MTDWDSEVSEHWERLAGRAGRNDMPYILFTAVADGRLSDPIEIAKGIEAAWTMAEWPLRISDDDSYESSKNLWSAMFSRAIQPGFEYLENAEFADTLNLPRTMTVYRGASDSGITGWSWTGSFDKAHWFATRMGGLIHHGESAKVFRLNVPREKVLAHFTEGRGEDEWVIRPESLRGRIRIIPESEYSEFRAKEKVSE